MGTLRASRTRGERSHAQRQSDDDAPGLRICRISGRGGRRLFHQNHEHDKTVRQTYKGQQSVCPPKELGRGRQHFHRQP